MSCVWLRACVRVRARAYERARAYCRRECSGGEVSSERTVRETASLSSRVTNSPVDSRIRTENKVSARRGTTSSRVSRDRNRAASPADLSFPSSVRMCDDENDVVSPARKALHDERVFSVRPKKLTNRLFHRLLFSIWRLWLIYFSNLLKRRAHGFA